MIQHSEIVYVNEIEYADGSRSCVFDPFVLTTYVGKNVISCEVRMFGERHGVCDVVPRRSVRSFSDLLVFHQDVMAKCLREDDVTYIDLEYHDYDKFVSER